MSHCLLTMFQPLPITASNKGTWDEKTCNRWAIFTLF